MKADAGGRELFSGIHFGMTIGGSACASRAGGSPQVMALRKEFDWASNPTAGGGGAGAGVLIFSRERAQRTQKTIFALFVFFCG
jgi:hypothetical protein